MQKFTNRYIIVKILKVNDKEKALKAARENSSLTWGPQQDQ